MIGAAALAAALTAFGAAAIAADTDLRLYLGDVDVNASVNVADAVLLARYNAEDTEIRVTRQGARNADINEDHYVDSLDNAMLLQVLAGLIPHPQDVLPAETTDTTPAVTTETAPGTSEAGTTTAADVTEETSSAETTAPGGSAEPAEDLIVDSVRLPIGKPTQDVITQPEIADRCGALTETLSLAYNEYSIDYFVFADNPKTTMILFSRAGTVVGYYAVGTDFQCSPQHKHIQYIDSHPEGTGKQYAALAVASSADISVSDLKDKSDFTVFNRLTFYAVNAIRAINRVPVLSWNEDMAGMADWLSSDMAANNYISKDHVDSNGQTPGDRIRALGIPWKYVGENTNAGQMDPFSAANSWYISRKDLHRDNLLNPNYTGIGIAYAYGENTVYKIYGTQEFIG